MAAHSQWLFWALPSAMSAALTAIFAKAGLQSIDSDFVPLVRTAMILLVVVLVFLHERRNSREWLGVGGQCRDRAHGVPAVIRRALDRSGP